jgi:hypothetical protein
MLASKRVAVLAVFLFAVFPAVATSTAAKAGGTGCAQCHREEVDSQRTTLMAQALELTATNPILHAHPKLIFQRGEFTYTVRTHDLQSTYSVSNGSQSRSVPIVWGMGSGAQTWLFQWNGKFFESMVSYFPSIGGLGITLGDEVLTPHTLTEAMGRELSQQDVKACFGCHTTGALVNNHLDLTALRPGVTCDHCHLGAETHMVDARHNQFASTPPSLGDLTSEGLSTFCGQCHRSWSTVVSHFWFGETNVRFAPYRLENSRCFNGTDPRISCIACHNPHQNVITDAAYYDRKCLACHTLQRAVARNLEPAEHLASKSCPVANSNCVSCHMPKVTRANEHLAFTDHFIRIVKPGEPYPD